MQEPIYLENPETRILYSLPNCEGIFDIYLVIFDLDVFTDDSGNSLYSAQWFNAFEKTIADSIEDEDFEHPIWVLHKTSTHNAEPISPLARNIESREWFTRNLTQQRPARTTHCLGGIMNGRDIYIRMGFHQWADKAVYNGPTSWASMNKIASGHVPCLTMENWKFWQAYHNAISSMSRHPSIIAANPTSISLPQTVY